MTSDVSAKTSLWDQLRIYLRETRAELRRVIWPTREETLNLSGVVLLVTLAMTVYLGALDSLFSAIFAALFNLFQNL